MLEKAVTQGREAKMIKKQQPLVRGDQKESTTSVSLYKIEDKKERPWSQASNEQTGVTST